MGWFTRMMLTTPGQRQEEADLQALETFTKGNVATSKQLAEEASRKAQEARQASLLSPWSAEKYQHAQRCLREADLLASAYCSDLAERANLKRLK